MAKGTRGQVRIIAGQWKRTPLPVLDAAGLRPTGDRQREMIFSWLTHLAGSFEGKKALDMFAGSGALSFEFLSRGGASALLFETNRRAAAAISETIQKLGAKARVLTKSSLAAGAVSDSDVFDLIFIDPPFAENLHEAALKKAVSVLSPEGLIYVESPSELSDEFLNSLNLQALRRAKTGASCLLLASKKQA